MNSPVQSPLKRHPDNPLIAPADLPIPCYAVFNSAAIMFDGQVLKILRVENTRREVQFHIARSADGIHFSIDPEPIYLPLSEIEKRHGRGLRFDVRVTEIDDLHYLCFANWMGGYGSMLMMAKTEDFKTFETFPYASEPSNRNGVLFPEKINGLYARLDRPQDIDGSGRIWVSYSPDLQFWGRSLPIKLPKPMWGQRKSGGGAVPIRTDQGWLCIYHSTSLTASTENYYLGAALLDLEDPTKVVACGREFILAAQEPYECHGQVPNVVFTCGAVEMPDGTLNIYYAGADTRVCLAQTTVEELVQFCLDSHHTDHDVPANFF